MPRRLIDAVGRGHVDPAMLGDGLVELRDLIALGQVGIEVVLARKDGALPHLAVDPQRSQRGELDGLHIQHRQRPGSARQTGQTLRVRRGAKVVGAAAEGLGGGQQLHMNFKPNHRLVLGENFRRKRSCAHIVFDFNAKL